MPELSMKILMLSYEFPPLGGGGSRVVDGLSKELVRIGHEEGTLITLLAPSGVGGTAAVAFSLLLYSRNLLLALAGGVLEAGYHLFPEKRKALEDPGGPSE